MKVHGLDITDQELINAEHGSTEGAGHDDDVVWSVVFRSKKRGQPEVLTPIHLHVAPRFDVKVLAREYGARMLNGATLVSMECCS